MFYLSDSQKIQDIFYFSDSKKSLSSKNVQKLGNKLYVTTMYLIFSTHQIFWFSNVYEIHEKWDGLDVFRTRFVMAHKLEIIFWDVTIQEKLSIAIYSENVICLGKNV